MLDIRPNTPIEEYELNGHPVFVKRDDMMGDGITLPQWAKLEAIQTIFESTTPLGIPLIDKSKPVSYMCNRASWSGWALSKIGTELGYDVKIGYPNSKNFPKQTIEKIIEGGGEAIPIKPNMDAVVIGSLKKLSRENGWFPFPYAFEVPTYIDYWKDRLANLEEDFDNLVVCSGTPCTSLGMCMGFRGENIYLVSTAKQSTAERAYKKYGLMDRVNSGHIEVFYSPFEFYDEMEEVETPFPCNPYWDKKVWHWLGDNIHLLRGKTLFWNIGA